MTGFSQSRQYDTMALQQPETSPVNLPADKQPPVTKRRDKRVQILQAARALVIDQGFPAVTMVEIADLAKVSRATLYRYYSTKDQIYNDVTIDWGINFVQSIRQSPPRQASAGERITAIIQKAVNAAADNPKLMAAYIAILISEDKLLLNDHRRFKGLMPGIIKVAVGNDHKPENMALACSTLQHVLISNLILLNAGIVDAHTITREMKQIAEQLLADVWDKR